MDPWGQKPGGEEIKLSDKKIKTRTTRQFQNFPLVASGILNVFFSVVRHSNIVIQMGNTHQTTVFLTNFCYEIGPQNRFKVSHRRRPSPSRIGQIQSGGFSEHRAIDRRRAIQRQPY